MRGRVLKLMIWSILASGWLMLGKMRSSLERALDLGQVREAVGTPLSSMLTTQSQSQSQRKGLRKVKEKGRKLVGLREEDEKDEANSDETWDDGQYVEEGDDSDETNSDETWDDGQYVEEGDDSDDDGMALSSNSKHGGDDSHFKLFAVLISLCIIYFFIFRGFGPLKLP
ncbi:hypothetical protein AMTR_s00132p00053560 [Amborella trichopoda]|uniref:Uncharacterized protein n=1 Tax=Amborella trichopoda TaxID=13333 RepID=W1NDQ2_AMBTC|nr:hypothetical protein AMTR_s00132p00053560 [Amborella trichopoda]